LRGANASRVDGYRSRSRDERHPGRTLEGSHAIPRGKVYDMDLHAEGYMGTGMGVGNGHGHGHGRSGDKPGRYLSFSRRLG